MRCRRETTSKADDLRVLVKLRRVIQVEMNFQDKQRLVEKNLPRNKDRITEIEGERIVKKNYLLCCCKTKKYNK